MSYYIYVPKGRAAEYAPLALNLFNGCPHRCAYCYVKLRFGGKDEPRPRVDLNKLRHELSKWPVNDRRRTLPIMLSFMCDPYPKSIPDYRDYVGDVLQILLGEGLHLRILSKSGTYGLAHLNHILAEHGQRVEFGQSITCVDDNLRDAIEPGAASHLSRVAALQQAHEAGLSTFISLEPVITVHAIANWLMRLKTNSPSFIDRINIGGPPNYWPVETRPEVCFAEMKTASGVQRITMNWARVAPDSTDPFMFASLVLAAKSLGVPVGLKRDAFDLLRSGAHFPICTEAVVGCERLWETPK